MLGEAVEDPNNMESGEAETSGTGGCESGLGLLPMTTVLEGDKKLVRRRYKGINWLNGLDWTGYEIHLGRTEFHKNLRKNRLLQRKLQRQMILLSVLLTANKK